MQISELQPFRKVKHDGRVVNALDLSSNGQMSTWVQTPLVLSIILFYVTWNITRYWDIEAHSSEVSFFGDVKYKDRTFFQTAKDAPIKILFTKIWLHFLQLLT